MFQSLQGRFGNMRRIDNVRRSCPDNKIVLIPLAVGLVLAARSEVEVINFLHQRSGITRPVTPTSRISGLVPPLREAIDDHGASVFDKFRATVVLGWILWILNEPEVALERLSTIDFDAIREKELKDQDMRDTKHETVIEGYLLKGKTPTRSGRASGWHRARLTIFRFYTGEHQPA